MCSPRLHSSLLVEHSLAVDKRGETHNMAKSQSLKLSALKQNVDYPVANKLVDKRCLIHVKLTESCLGAIEALMNSDKVSHCYQNRCETSIYFFCMRRATAL